FHVPCQSCYFKIGHCSYVDETIEGFFQSATHRVRRRRAIRKGDDFEFRTVVNFEQLRHQISRGVVVEILRKIAYPYFVMDVSFAVPTRETRRKSVFDDRLGTALLLSRR